MTTLELTQIEAHEADEEPFARPSRGAHEFTLEDRMAAIQASDGEVFAEQIAGAQVAYPNLQHTLFTLPQEVDSINLGAIAEQLEQSYLGSAMGFNSMHLDFQANQIDITHRT